jgi:hypothetical protein
LQVGQTVTGFDGRAIAIVSIVVDPRPAPVYNLEVDGTSTFFVEGMWVHNSACAVAYHHLLPRQFEKFFKKAGLDIEEFVIPLEKEFHKTLHGKGGTIAESWNGKWGAFFGRHPNAGPDEILAEYGRLFREFFLR